MTKAPRSTRALTQGAMFAALTIAMVLAGVVFPPLQILFIALPVPIAIATISSGLNVGMMAGLVAALLAGLVTRTPDAVLTVAAAGAVGIAIGYALEQRFPAIKALLFSAVVSAVTRALEFAVMIWIVGLAELGKTLQKSLSMNYQLAERMPALFGTTDPKVARQMVEATLKLYKLGLPTLIIVTLVSGGIFNYFLARAAARRLGLPASPGFPPFREWRSPKWFAWIYVASILGSSLAPAIKGSGTALTVVFFNAQAIFAFFFMLQGMAVVWHLFDRYHIDGLGRWVLTGIIFITGIGLQIVAFVGLFDVWLDYRRPREGAK